MNVSPATGNFGIENRKIGMLLFIVSEVMFFTGFAGAYMVLRKTAVQWPAAADYLNLPSMAAGILILFVSAFFARKGKYPAAALAAVLFLAAQAWVCYNLVTVKNLHPSSNLWAAFFFTLTGLHALHVLGGLAWMALPRKPSPLGYYYYFVAFLQLALTGLFYF